jgi:hypothetical protein
MNDDGRPVSRGPWARTSSRKNEWKVRTSSRSRTLRGDGAAHAVRDLPHRSAGETQEQHPLLRLKRAQPGGSLEQGDRGLAAAGPALNQQVTGRSKDLLAGVVELHNPTFNYWGLPMILRPAG